MMKRAAVARGGVTLILALLVGAAPVLSADALQKPTKAKLCMGCHPGAEPGNLRGEFDSVAMKSQTIQIKIDDVKEVLKFDKKSLKVLNPSDPADLEKTLRGIKKGQQVRVEYTEKDGMKSATLLSIKPPLKVAPEKLYKTWNVEKLVAMGPEKGKYFLVDSRPPIRFAEGSIPTAVNIPYGEIKKSLDKFPKERDALIIFFCQGPTCALSPQSASFLESQGYTNVKVYHDGYPEWSKKHVSVITPTHLQKSWIEKELSFILIDARPAKVAAKGFIPGAVGIPAAVIDKAIKSFPDPEKKPPIIVYDQKGGADAEKVAKKLLAAGYAGTKVVTGGFEGWKKAGFTVASGKPATKVAWVPKPKPGSCPVEEFEMVGRTHPADVQIVDVRNREEVDETGMIKGAINIPADEMATRYTELPKDKKLILHCSTGARAEMAYNILKEKGFNVRFLNATIANYEDGTFKITK
ncbi:MAG: sulfur transferase selenocysteine-containing protein [Desulfuromonadia bacterium]